MSVRQMPVKQFPGYQRARRSRSLLWLILTSTNLAFEMNYARKNYIKLWKLAQIDSWFSPNCCFQVKMGGLLDVVRQGHI